jgi:hypothetical protein
MLPNCLIAPVSTQVTDELFYFASNQIVKDLRNRTGDPSFIKECLLQNQKNQSAAGLESLFRAQSSTPGPFNVNSPGQFDHVQETWGSERTSSEGG